MAVHILTPSDCMKAGAAKEWSASASQIFMTEGES
jgi:hypothetical protein